MRIKDIIFQPMYLLYVVHAYQTSRTENSAAKLNI